MQIYSASGKREGGRVAVCIWLRGRHIMAMQVEYVSNIGGEIRSVQLNARKAPGSIPGLK